MIYIGIDPGTHTGVAVWDTREGKFLSLETLPIHRALQEVYNWRQRPAEIQVVFEDARQRRWYGKESNDKLQGAGSVKRDSKIWEEFCTDNHIPFEAEPPRPGLTKWNAKYWANVIGWKGRTSEHARDAALLVWGRKDIR